MTDTDYHDDRWTPTPDGYRAALAIMQATLFADPRDLADLSLTVDRVVVATWGMEHVYGRVITSLTITALHLAAEVTMHELGREPTPAEVRATLVRIATRFDDTGGRSESSGGSEC